MAFLSPLSTSRAPGPYLTTPEPLDKPSSPYYTLTTFFNYPKGKPVSLFSPHLPPSPPLPPPPPSPSPRPPLLISPLISPLFSSHLFFHLPALFVLSLHLHHPPTQLPLFIPTFHPTSSTTFPVSCYHLIFFLSLHSAVFFLLSFCLP